MARGTPLAAACAAVLALLAFATTTTTAHARVSSDVAALQVALRALHLYKGGVDGVAGPATRRAVRRLQRRRHLPVDGIAGPRTRRALGRRGRPPLGSRTMRTGHRGWDVAALQFLLRRRGCGPASIDGGFGPGTAAAVRTCQRRRGLPAAGLAGPSTIRVLRSAPRRTATRSRSVAAAQTPVRFLRPIAAPMTDGFGPRGNRPHHGVDFPAASGTPVTAGGGGVVRSAGYNAFGYGNLVIVSHRLGFESWYAHLSSVAVVRGQSVSGGVLVGRVGSTGHSTGPHLHFEVRRNGTPIDPVPLLLN
ncbi:MAG TPA: peptidoglycan DD-metalloendopeptidase family protein [Solirubrobacteraceae bacterium]|nr:peptidoglycan DD-metalloendopeptidase family protein [Solirubrobacteraceae bacterium]